MDSQTDRNHSSFDGFHAFVGVRDMKKPLSAGTEQGAKQNNHK